MAVASEPWHLDFAAKAIGFAVLFDGLDGRIARMTNTASDFGRELDSLADVITFGWLRHCWRGCGDFICCRWSRSSRTAPEAHAIGIDRLLRFSRSRERAGLARFNIAKNPQPSNPGRPGKKYFVGMPIPAGAGVIAAVRAFFRRRAD